MKYTNMRIKDYEPPRTWIAEVEPSGVLANSYIDGGDGFLTIWNGSPGDEFLS